MENSKRGNIPMQEKLRLSKSQGALTPAELKRMQNVPYALVVGSIMYDVKIVLALMLRLLKTISKPISQNLLKVSCYTDVGYLTDVDDSKSQTGYVFVLNGGAVDWKSVKQSFRYLSICIESGLGVVPTIEEPINMYCDNTEAMTIANESGITKEKVHTDNNLADPFTKALDFPKHSEHTMNIGMLPASSFMQVCDD
ncbi:hypothetical protein Tco_1121803 [Tanacetum coccineum]|uniref:Retrotransposon protein n=1 Tax=Tanacetum coccineum TaxID=301880 RepID=A0ABQ5J1P0_9ASTR